MISKDLLQILACPACKSPVMEAGDFLFCTNADCRRRYTVKEGIPVMMVDEADVLELHEFSTVVRPS